MKDKLKKILIQIFASKIGLFFVSVLLALIFCILENYYTWAEIAMYISLLYPTILTLVMIGYAIKNTIRDYKSDKKLRDGK